MALQRAGCFRSRSISRRTFLHLAGATVASAAAAACTRGPEATTPPPAPTVEPPPLAVPSPPREQPLPVATVAIAQAADYDGALIARRMRDLLDSLDGLGDVVRGGDRVAIKVNLTGGVDMEPLPGVLPIESYVTHPEVVRALGTLLLDAGAKQLYIVEAVYEWASFTQWGYAEIARDLDATLIDLNGTDPYADYIRMPVGDGSFVYPDFVMNPILNDVDVFVSVSKMKHHWDCGVTHTLKNAIGLVPAAFYRLEKEHVYRSAFHGLPQETRTRLPRVIVDLNRARPIHLALVDGVKSTQGGEGPWIDAMRPVEPALLMAGKDPVATDAVATALMGVDPTADYPTTPFIRGDNHLNLASQMGLGVNHLDEIKTVGPQIEDVRYRFDPGWD